jgi:MFS transporter, SET family, sugar efflux transporter
MTQVAEPVPQTAAEPLSRKVARTFAAIPAVLQDPYYRACFVSLFLLGYAISAFFPYMTIWATGTFGISAFAASLLHVPAALVGVTVNLLLSAYSDRVGRRKRLVAGLELAGACFYLLAPFVKVYPVVLAIAPLAGLNGFSLLLTLVSDRVRREPPRAGLQGAALFSAVRMAFSLGFLVGPVTGAQVIGLGGFMPLLFFCALLRLLNAAWVGYAVKEMERSPGQVGMPVRAAGAIPIGLLLLCAASLVVHAGEFSRILFLPLYITGALGLGPVFVALPWTVQLLCELFVIPATGHWADQFGVRRIFLLGLLGSSLALVGLGLSSVYWPILAIHVLLAFNAGALAGVGFIYAQRVHPQGPALASALYFSSLQLSTVISSLAIGPLWDRMTLPYPFFVGATFGLIAFLIALPVREAAATRQG